MNYTSAISTIVFQIKPFFTTFVLTLLGILFKLFFLKNSVKYCSLSEETKILVDNFCIKNKWIIAKFQKRSHYLYLTYKQTLFSLYEGQYFKIFYFLYFSFTVSILYYTLQAKPIEIYETFIYLFLVGFSVFILKLHQEQESLRNFFNKDDMNTSRNVQTVKSKTLLLWAVCVVYVTLSYLCKYFFHNLMRDIHFEILLMNLYLIWTGFYSIFWGLFYEYRSYSPEVSSLIFFDYELMNKISFYLIPFNISICAIAIYFGQKVSSLKLYDYMALMVFFILVFLWLIAQIHDYDLYRKLLEKVKALEDDKQRNVNAM